MLVRTAPPVQQGRMLSALHSAHQTPVWETWNQEPPDLLLRCRSAPGVMCFHSPHLSHFSQQLLEASTLRQAGPGPGTC